MFGKINGHMNPEAGNATPVAFTSQDAYWYSVYTGLICGPVRWFKYAWIMNRAYAMTNELAGKCVATAVSPLTKNNEREFKKYRNDNDAMEE